MRGTEAKIRRVRDAPAVWFLGFRAIGLTGMRHGDLISTDWLCWDFPRRKHDYLIVDVETGAALDKANSRRCCEDAREEVSLLLAEPTRRPTCLGWMAVLLDDKGALDKDLCAVR